MLLLVLCIGTPGGSTGNGSGFKASKNFLWLSLGGNQYRREGL